MKITNENLNFVDNKIEENLGHSEISSIFVSHV